MVDIFIYLPINVAIVGLKIKLVIYYAIYCY